MVASKLTRASSNPADVIGWIIACDSNSDADVDYVDGGIGSRMTKLVCPLPNLHT